MPGYWYGTLHSFEREIQHSMMLLLEAHHSVRNQETVSSLVEHTAWFEGIDSGQCLLQKVIESWQFVVEAVEAMLLGSEICHNSCEMSTALEKVPPELGSFFSSCSFSDHRFDPIIDPASHKESTLLIAISLLLLGLW
jgi:hypothetical protein